MTISVETLNTLLDPNNKDFQNGLQNRVWSLRPLKRPKEKYLVVIPSASYMVMITSEENAEALNVKLPEQQIKEIEKKLFEVRKEGCVVKIETLREWVNNYKSIFIDGDKDIAGVLGDSKVNLVILDKLLSIFTGDTICIYPPLSQGSEKPYIFEGHGYRAILSPIYSQSVVKTIEDGFSLDLESMPGGYLEFIKSGRDKKPKVVTPESLWKEYFGSITNS